MTKKAQKTDINEFIRMCPYCLVSAGNGHEADCERPTAQRKAQ
jgi:hypothetical protein